MAPSPYIFIISICPVDMNVDATFDEIPSMTLKVIKKTKVTDGRKDRRTDNVKTVYPPTNTVGGGGGGGGGGGIITSNNSCHTDNAII